MKPCAIAPTPSPSLPRRGIPIARSSSKHDLSWITAKHTYVILGAGVDLDGWYKVRLRRSDGREIKATKKRVAQLRREGRIVEPVSSPDPARSVLWSADLHEM